MSYYRSLIQRSLVANLVAAYKLSNANDSYNGYNGTAAGAVVFNSTNAVDGLAGQFINSSASVIYIPDNTAFSFTNGTTDSSFSIKANIYPTSFGYNIRTIFSKANQNFNNASEYLFYVYMGSLRIVCFDKASGGGYIGAEVAGSISINTAYNVVVTYDGSGAWTGFKIYINGTLRTTTAFNNGSYTSMSNTTITCTIGNNSNGQFRFIGTIDENYIFNKELTQSEVTFLQTNYYPNI